MLKQGDLFDVGQKRYIALQDPYVKFVQDPDAWDSKYDVGSAYRFVKAQQVLPIPAEPTTIKLDGSGYKVVQQVGGTP